MNKARQSLDRASAEDRLIRAHSHLVGARALLGRCGDNHAEALAETALSYANEAIEALEARAK